MPDDSSLDVRILGLVRDLEIWKHVGHVHTWLYRMTGGRVGHAAGSFTNLLLTTTGRRSGEPRTVALAYLADGDDMVIVASNSGSDKPPAWWLNLKANPKAEVQVGSETFAVRSRIAEGEERARLWERLAQANPFYPRYERMTDRRIPVVVLSRASS